MKLKLVDATFAIVKLPAAEPIPPWAVQGNIFSVTRTDEELSIVCPSEFLPENNGVEVEPDWSCIKVEGPLDFGLTGILASLANPLAERKISIFAISTYNTDYLLVKSRALEQAKAALELAGHTFID